jgi:hypothetical protein
MSEPSRAPTIFEPHWSTALTLWGIVGTFTSLVSHSWPPIAASIVVGGSIIAWERWQNRR